MQYLHSIFYPTNKENSSSKQVETVVFLHGLYGDASDWLHYIETMTKQFNVLLLDLRNHGQSFHAKGMSYPTLAFDVVQTLRYLELTSVSLVGHSMGGKTAMMLAYAYPELIKKIAILDIAHHRYIPKFTPITDILMKLPLDKIKKHQDAKVWLANRIRYDVLRDFLLRNLVLRDGCYQWRVNLSEIQSSTDDIAGGLPFSSCNIPALFLYGEESQYIGPEDHGKIRRVFTKAKLVGIPQAGHLLHCEQPEMIAHELTEFLNPAFTH